MPARGVIARAIGVIVRQFKQGVTPEQVALTIALGFVIGIFPILGATTILCGIAAAVLGLNQPIIQLVNYVAYPAQLVALIPFYRAGESLFRQPHLPLSIPMLMDRFRDDAGKFFSAPGARSATPRKSQKQSLRIPASGSFRQFKQQRSMTACVA